MSGIGLLIGLTLLSPVVAQVSPFNGLEVKVQQDAPSYRMIISGHLHGASSDRSGLPASTVLAGMDRINGAGADLFLSTGDLFLIPEKEFDGYDRAFFSKLTVPFFNAPGNHDKDRFYQERFGPADLTIPMGKDRIVLLDSERKNGSLEPDQLQLLESLLEEPVPRNVFIISHRPIWAEDDDRYSTLFKGNTRAMFGTNYRQAVWPLLERISERSQVFWISGSMAGNAPTSFFFQPHATNITFIQSAIRDERHDALLLADVKDGMVEWSAIPLGSEPVLPPEAYDRAWWLAQRKAPKKFNWRLVPYIARTAVQHPFFWYGAGFSLLISLVLRRLFRRGL